MKSMNKLKANQLYIAYSILIFVMTSLIAYQVFWSISFFGLEQSIHYILEMMPYMLLLETLPLSAFVYLLLKKGSGLTYFRSWSMGKWLRFSALLMLFGYLLVLIPAPITLFIFFRNGGFLSAADTFPYSSLYFDLIYIGSAMMFSGFVALICLWMTHRRRSSTQTAQENALNYSFNAKSM